MQRRGSWGTFRARSYAGGSGERLEKVFLRMRCLSWGLSNEQELSVTGRAPAKVLWLEGSGGQKKFLRPTWLKTGSVCVWQGLVGEAGSLQRGTDKTV